MFGEQFSSKFPQTCLNLGCEATFSDEAGLQSHRGRCVFQRDSCLQCHQKVVRKFLPKHMLEECDFRPTQCTYCGKEYIAPEISEHLSKCPKRTASCAHCNEVVSFVNLELHLAVCKKGQTACIAKDLGCDFQGDAKALKEHNRNVEVHFPLLCQCLSEMKNEMRRFRAENEEDRLLNRQLMSQFGIDMEKVHSEMRKVSNKLETIDLKNSERDEYLELMATTMESLHTTVSENRELLQERIKEYQEVLDGLVLRLSKWESELLSNTGERTEYETLRAQGDEKLNLMINSKVFPRNALTLDMLLEYLKRQIFSLSEPVVTQVTPRCDLQDRWTGWRELGQRSINGTDFSCELFQEEYADHGRMIKLNLKAVLPNLPIYADRCLFCTYDPTNFQVLMYNVKEGDRTSGLLCFGVTQSFGYFMISPEEYDEMRRLSTFHRVEYAFLIYKYPP